MIEGLKPFFLDNHLLFSFNPFLAKRPKNKLESDDQKLFLGKTFRFRSEITSTLSCAVLKSTAFFFTFLFQITKFVSSQRRYRKKVLSKSSPKMLPNVSTTDEPLISHWHTLAVIGRYSYRFKRLRLPFDSSKSSIMFLILWTLVLCEVISAEISRVYQRLYLPKSACEFQRVLGLDASELRCAMHFELQLGPPPTPGILWWGKKSFANVD